MTESLVVNPQFFKSPGGENLVVLSRLEFDALLDALEEAQEELADIEVLDQRLAEMAANPVPLLPVDVSALLLKGHRRLAALRVWRGLTVADLARKARITEAELTRFESGETITDAAVVERLASTLDVPTAWFAQ